MKYPRRASVTALLHEKGDADALLDVEDILILVALRRHFFFLAVAVQIQHVNFAETLQEGLPHAAEGGVIQPAVVGDERQNSLTVVLDTPLAEADEFDVVIHQPTSATFIDGSSIHFSVVIQ